jgi:hypothetical protein
LQEEKAAAAQKKVLQAEENKRLQAQKVPPSNFFFFFFFALHLLCGGRFLMQSNKKNFFFLFSLILQELQNEDFKKVLDLVFLAHLLRDQQTLDVLSSGDLEDFVSDSSQLQSPISTSFFFPSSSKRGGGPFVLILSCGLVCTSASSLVQTLPSDERTVIERLFDQLLGQHQSNVG